MLQKSLSTSRASLTCDVLVSASISASFGKKKSTKGRQSRKGNSQLFAGSHCKSSEVVRPFSLAVLKTDTISFCKPFCKKYEERWRCLNSVNLSTGILLNPKY